MEEDKKLAEERPVGGTETILLAEDDESVRAMTRIVLENIGYKVITAIDGQDAVNTYQENKSKIHLLLFDIIMPKKTGKDAYDEIRAIQPDIKILFQSGYAPDIIHQKLVLDEKMTVVYKPVTPTELMRCVTIMEIINMADFKQYAVTNDVTLSESRINWRYHSHSPKQSG